jgi:hypothetical protein
MKTRIAIGSLIPIIIGMMACQVLAQGAENDDMYFNSKDREKLKAEKGPAFASVNDKIDSDYNTFRKKHFDKDEEAAEKVNETTNPTDSYSARTINPEYISRSNSEQASEDENYYVEGYVPANTYDSYSANGNNNNSNYNNSYYGNNGYGNNSYYGNYGYGSPSASLYGPYYQSCNPWMSPYYSGGSGLSFSFGYMFGNPGWNYGMSYGYGNSYYNPYNYPSYYSPYYGYGYAPGYYYGGSEASQPNYGKRPSRHSAIVSPTPRSSDRTRSIATNDGTPNGRSRQVDEYYVKPLKRATIIDNYINSSTGSSRDRYVRPSSDSPASRTRDSYNSSNSTRDRPSYSAPSRSSSSDVSRSSSGSSSSGRSSSPASRKRD